MLGHKIQPKAFVSPALKVKRAYRHITEIEALLKSVRENHPCTSFVQPCIRPGEFIVGVEFSQEALKAKGDAPLIIGDIVHNLRTALDHIAYGIVSAFEKPPDFLYFPIGVEINSLKGQRSFGIIERVAPDIAGLILDEIKPYGVGNLFVSLNHLDRTDKHHLVLVADVLADVLLRIVPEDDTDISADAKGFLLAVGTPNRAPTEGSNAWLHNQQNSYPAFDICFGEGQPFENEPIVPAMHQLAQLVANTIQVLATHCFGEHP